MIWILKNPIFFQNHKMEIENTLSITKEKISIGINWNENRKSGCNEDHENSIGEFDTRNDFLLILQTNP